MVDSSKFLGIIINSSLDWTEHINLINQKVSKTIGILKYVTTKLPIDVLRSLYFSLVNPYYEYGNLVWTVTSNEAFKKLLITHRKAIRVITGSQWNAHTSSLFQTLKILKIDELHKLQVACFMFKVHRGLMPAFFAHMFCVNSDIHHYNTRHAADYHITAHRTSLLKNTIRIAGPLLWNSIDLNVRLSTSVHSFRRKYKDILIG